MRGSAAHPPVHDPGHGVDELARLQLAGEVPLLGRARAGELGAVTADADVHEGRVRPQFGPDAADPPLGLRVLLDERAGGQPHGLLGLVADGRHSRLVDEAELDHLAGHAAEWVAGPPGGLFLFAAVAEGAARERTVLVKEAVDERFDDYRAIPRAEPLLRPLHREVHGERVHAVDPPGGDAEAEGARRQPRFPGGLLDGGGHGVHVVLDEEAERQVPRGGQVEALQHRADVGRAVAEVGDGEVVGAGVLLRPGVARRHRHAAPDDGVGAERPGLEPLQVHGAAAPAAVPLGQPEDLGQRALQHGLDLRRDQVRRVQHALGHVGDRLGQELVVAAVRAVDGVRRAERDDGADRAALLADAGVRRAVHQALARQLEDRLLERPDEVQLAEHGREQPGVGRLPVRRRRAQLGPPRRGMEALLTWHRHLPRCADPFTGGYCANVSISTANRRETSGYQS